MKTTSKRKSIWRYLFLFVFLLVTGLLLWAKHNTRDRHPDYQLHIKHQSQVPGQLNIGFAAVDISPDVTDTWTDINGDAKYVEADGDTYVDKNGNGKFDPVWMAGFQNQRPAQGIHDPLSARSIVIDDGEFILAWAVLDMIGYGNDDIIEVRNQVQEQSEIDYVIVASTHTHEGPDLIGLWGDSYTSSGVNPEYRQFVIDQTVASVLEAYKKRKPAKLRFSQDLTGAIPYVTDTRKPTVLDPGLRIMHVQDAQNDTSLGTLISWANHPETLWNKNLLISSDFPHYIREGVEKGTYYRDSLVKEGLGGVAIFANGSIGGLMTTHPSFGIPHPHTGEILKEPGYAKTEAQGVAIAEMVLSSIEASQTSQPIENAALYVKANTIELPLQNPLYKIAMVLGVLDRGITNFWTMRSELAYWRLGPAEFLHHPAEIYPEIVNGGVEAPEGQDFPIQPFESPSIRSFMKAEYTFVMGLSNDMIGYTIPKSQWDEEAPFTYDNKDAPYGEENSLGPETGPILYQEMRKLLEVSEK